MPLYDYTGIDDYGKSHKGQCEAQGEKDLEVILSQRGLYLLETREQYQIIKSQRVIKSSRIKKWLIFGLGIPFSIFLIFIICASTYMWFTYETGYLEVDEGPVPVFKTAIIPTDSKEIVQQLKFLVPNHTRCSKVNIPTLTSSYPTMCVSIKEGIHEGEKGYVLRGWFKKQ
ncbi:MAG: hypothetical protein Q6359_10675 [Candidatus Brocadiales bacterium]|nr:hypothetical protein [Candidatus Brocadiales bacterium]